MNPDLQPRVSVVVPVRNRPDLLQSTLQSLAMQDLSPSAFEVVVCDDGSTDDIAAVVSKFDASRVRIALHRQPPLGPAAARNMGIRASQANVIVFIDSDVLVDRMALRLLIEALESNQDWQGAEAALQPSDDRVGVLWDAPSSQEGGRFHTAAIAYRRTALYVAGGFDEAFALPACEDVELALRVLKLGPIGFVPNAIVIHPSRRVTLRTHWRWRNHWKFETILALRYGILAFPGKLCGPFPRLRLAWSAVVTLPAGRFIAALQALRATPLDAVVAALYAVFDVLCGLIALPVIFFQPLPERRNALLSNEPVPVGEVIA